jgi:3'-phosphoadenosine 5'-phosphosulfate sulfotransferase (PAPS reductase)/FAD synthetase
VDRARALLRRAQGRRARARAGAAPTPGSPASAASRRPRARTREPVEWDEQARPLEVQPAGDWTEKDLWRASTSATCLEAEAIHIMREVAAEFERPVLLFSGGKDSIVLLRLAEKAFRPARFPFPVMHVDTGHNFPEVSSSATAASPSSASG